ncbi:MAG: DNA polymerase IV [Alphaproteobacteria bacterium]
MTSICRDCLKDCAPLAARCAQCGGTRLFAHAELHSLSIAHIDCDAFYASVEKRDHPELVGRPLIIGGGKRGVVTTACYLARTKGVRSAMPMYRALKLCPGANVVKPNFQKYITAGRAIRQKMFEMTDIVQPLSIDEAFLDLSASTKPISPAKALMKFAKEVEGEFRLSVSIGLSHNKLMAKIASDLDKPSGFHVIGKQETEAFLADKPVSILWGVGKATAGRLAKKGVNTVGQLRGLTLDDLNARHGSFGQGLYEFSRGIDTRSVKHVSKSKSISTETTFSGDLDSRADLEEILKSLSTRLSDRLVKSNYAGRTITIKMKTKDFQLITRSHTLNTPTCLSETMFETGLALLVKELDGRKFRLLGIGAHDLVDISEADSFDLADPERAALYSKLVDT